jgi:2,4-dienoyl-CoA reductase-like NADH-dependent reductase (Old Yellow Enzyme family)
MTMPRLHKTRRTGYPATRKLTGKPTITAGSVGLDTEFLEAVPQGKAGTTVALDRLLSMRGQDRVDTVAIGRALRADGEWADKGRRAELTALQPFYPRILRALL